MRRLSEYQSATAGMVALDLIRWAAETFGPDGVTIASSLGAEDQVVVSLLRRADVRIPVFTLDTGRLFAEAYDLIDRIREEMGITIDTYFPDAGQVEHMVREAGVNLFYASVENRKRCCHVRKVAPLARALAGRNAWITGLRRDQAVTRAEVSALSWDDANGLYKINPLWNWTSDMVWSYIREHGVPYNPLHDRGFPSIGCAPCTRAVAPGEDPRAGRWWWEQPDHKECGLHITEAEPDRSTPRRSGLRELPFGIRPVRAEPPDRPEPPDR